MLLRLLVKLMMLDVVIDVGVSLALLGGLGASQIDLVQVAKKGFPVHHSAIILTP